MSRQLVLTPEAREHFTSVTAYPQESSPGSPEEGVDGVALNRNNYIVFVGTDGEKKRIVEVLANEAAPTPSGGYAKWARVQRPQRKALTILEGYEPMTLTVPVLFDAVRQNSVVENVEYQIQKLEWMGGRGILFRAEKNHQAGVGKPPLVVVYSGAYEGGERSTELIPKPFQTKDIRWFVDDITFDEHPLRSPLGARIRQAVVVKLVEYVQDLPPAPGPSKPSYRVYRTTPSLNTVKKLVKHALEGAHTAARYPLAEAVAATIAENRSNKAIGTNPEKPLKKHTAVKIPTKYLQLI